jgi:DNA-binding NtrC family response regulator
MTTKHVLIVEDDSTQTKVFEQIVSKVHFKSHLVANGKDALKYLKDNKDVGLVLLDLALPDISGIQVLEELKKMGNKVPVAILSASEESSIAVRAGQLGAADFFIKGKSDLMRIFEFIDDVMNRS